jgi:DNA-binding NtrC family response regulator
MNSKILNILLVDDDKDDCFFFKEALDELEFSTHPTIVHDGQQLMHYLYPNADDIPNVLFLNLNRPLKNGFTCLMETKQSKISNILTAINFSGSFNKPYAAILFENRALHYIYKPAAYSHLKSVIKKTLKLVAQEYIEQPVRELFLIGSLKFNLL